MRYYVLDGHEVVPADLFEWATFFGTVNRRLALTEIGLAVSVSTVFLGIDHNFGTGPLAVFETMVFGGPMNGHAERYATWKEAVTGHCLMVVEVDAATRERLQAIARGEAVEPMAEPLVSEEMEQDPARFLREMKRSRDTWPTGEE